MYSWTVALTRAQRAMVSGAWLGVLLLVSACSGPIDYKPLDAPEPSNMNTHSDLEIELVEIESSTPAVGSDDTLDFVVRIINSGNKTFIWPDPCPAYYWSWQEGGEEFGSGYRYLNCASAPDLGPMGSADFSMEIPAAQTIGAEGFGWDLAGLSPCDTFAFFSDPLETEHAEPDYSRGVDECKKDNDSLFATDD